MFAEVKDLIFQLLELLILQPHPSTGWTVVDLDLVPNCWHQVRIAFGTFHFASGLIHGKNIIILACCSEVPALTHSMAIM